MLGPTSMHEHGHSTDDGGGGGHDMDMSMPMFFTFGVDTYLWLRSIHPTSGLPFFGVWLLLFAFGVAHEALASYRVTFQAQLRPKLSSASALSPQGYAAVPALVPSDRAAALLRFRLLNSSLYTANLATGYLLMLAVMTYNAYFFLAVVLGMGLGHLACFSKPHHLRSLRVDSCCETAAGGLD